jgi:thiopeptide-type bacteriocin biosynthesis protein
MSEAQPTWLSLHLDLAYSGNGWGEVYGVLTDEVLTGFVRPLVDDLVGRGWVQRFFFIRYRDPGAHVRLRLLAPREKHRGVVSAAEQARAEYLGDGISRQIVTGIRQEVYQQEIARYGGPVGVGISERLFETSSTLALDTLPAIVRARGDRALRFGHAAMGALLLVGGLLGDEAVSAKTRMLELYERTQLRLFAKEDSAVRVTQRIDAVANGQDSLLDKLATVYRAVEEPDRLPDPLSSAARSILEIRRAISQACNNGALRFNGDRAPSRSKALRTLAYSYLHMHLNRLGVGTIHEPYVARIACRALERTGRVPQWA